MADPTPEQLEAKIKERAKEFADAKINDPSEAQYQLIEECMTVGWQMGVTDAIQYMKNHGVQLG